jgi:L,D-transpeptidase YcbB
MKFRRRFVIPAIATVVLLTATPLVMADSRMAPLSFILNQSPVSSIIETSAIRKAGLIDEQAIKTFFRQRGGSYYWQGMMGPTRDADYLVDVIGKSWTHGLNPEKYHYSDIKILMKKGDRDSAAGLEILLTDAFIRYVRDMSGMRVSASAMGLDAKDWLQPYTIPQSLAFLNDVKNIRGLLNGLPPQSQTYKALQKELIHLSDEPPASYEEILPISLNGVTLKPMQRHKNVPLLRERLGVKQQTEDASLYDDRLAAAVIKFQHATGQPADGIVGPTTLKLLNRSRGQQLLQVIANLERLRWVDENRPNKFVMVNIPAATLWAVEDNRVVFQMPVIVGKKKRETQSFITEITGVRFNPDWTVPPTIKREDILPKLVENPNYLTDKGMELIHVTPEGAQTIDPLSVDWTTIAARDLASLEMVQIPGAHNPLGRIRILMPNKYNIYLHDTNQPEYFERAARAQSSGCVRMKEPEKMVEFVMDDEPGWDDKKMKSMLALGRTRDVKIAQPIPIYLLYYTAWSDENGRMIFGNDIYDQDKKLIQLLRNIDGIALPGHTEAASVSSGRPKLASAG